MFELKARRVTFGYLQGDSKPCKGAVSLKSEIALSDIIVGDAKYLGLQIDSHYPLTSCNSVASTPKMDNETKQVRSIFFLFIYNENEFTDIVWNQLESRHFLRQLYFPSY